MFSLVAFIISAVTNALLVGFDVLPWWLGLILFFIGWIFIWALLRVGGGDSFSNLGDAFFDAGEGGSSGGGDSGGSSSCGSGSGG